MSEPVELAPSVPRRREPVRIAAAAIVAAALVVFLVGFASGIRDLQGRVSTNAARDFYSLQLSGADGVGISNDILVAAENTLPTDARYALVLPDDGEAAAKEGIAETTVEALQPYTQYLLLPRRLVPVDEARYVLCYGCSGNGLPAGLRRVWDNGHGLWIATARR